MFHDLRGFLDVLRNDQDLVTIDAEVDPHLELPEIHRRVIAAGGPALLFKNVKGADWPLATNLFGTPRRVERGFGRDPQRFLEDVTALAQRADPPGLKDVWRLRGWIPRALGIGLKHVSRGPVTEVVRTPPQLDRIPFTTSWPEDGGPFLTQPLVYTQHPDDGRHNLGMYRIQRHDATTTGVHWQIGKGGGFHHARAEERGERLPIVIHLGGPPALLLSAVAPLPENVPELILASMVQGRRLRQASNPVAGHPLPVVAEAECALVGWVPPGVRRPEGPFGDHYGYYSLQHDYPIMECQAVLHRRDPIIPATVVGKPRQEDFYMGDYLQELLSPLFPLVMPAVKDLWSYGETGFHSLAAAVVRVRYPREAYASALRILGEGQLSLTKFLLLTDADVDLRDFLATLEAVLERTDLETDLVVLTQTSMDSLDYAGPEVNKGSKGFWMGVGEPRRQLPGGPPASLPRGVEVAGMVCKGCLVVEGDAFDEDRDLPRALAEHPDLADYPLVVLTDRGQQAARDPARFLWVTFTRFAPETDLYPRETRVTRHHMAYSLPVVLDARMKPWYPGEVLCDDDTKALVSRRWSEYFPQGGVEQGPTD